MKYTIELPLPPKACSPNASVVWQRRANARRNYRTECKMLYRAHLWSFAQQADALAAKGSRGHFLCPNGVTLSYEFFQAQKAFKDGRARFRDADNALAAMKAAQDALMDACIISCDSAEIAQIGRVIVHSPAKSNGRTCVVLTIEPMEASR